jgi:hypothetical protein
MSNYTKSTDFAAKDSYLTTDVRKIVKGTEIDDELNAIQTAVNSKAELAGSASQNFTANNITANDVSVTGDLSLTNGGVVRAYGRFQTNNTYTLESGNGFDSISSDSIGVYDFVLTTARADTDYSIHVSQQGRTGAPATYSSIDRLYTPSAVVTDTSNFTIYIGGATGSSNPEYAHTEVEMLCVAILD